MYNPFSYILLLTKRITKHSNFTYIRMIGAMIIFILCMVILVKWNTIPHIEDEAEILIEKNKDLKNDSLHVSVSVQRTNLSFNSPLCKNIGLSVSMFGGFERYNYNDVIDNCTMDSLKYYFNQKGINENTDSSNVIIYFKGKSQLYGSNVFELGKYNVSDYLIQKANGNIVFCTPSKVKKDSSGVFIEQCGFYLNNSSEPQQQILANLYNSRTRLSNYYINIMRLEDISQCYYKLKIKSLNYAFDDINHLKIDFGGATDFSSINPSPDIVTFSGIEYSNKDKIRKILFDGELKMFCQFHDTNGIQNTRIYLLTTIATLFFGVFMKLLYDIVVYSIKRKL